MYCTRLCPPAPLLGRRGVFCVVHVCCSCTHRDEDEQAAAGRPARGGAHKHQGERMPLKRCSQQLPKNDSCLRCFEKLLLTLRAPCRCVSSQPRANWLESLKRSLSFQRTGGPQQLWRLFCSVIRSLQACCRDVLLQSMVTMCVANAVSNKAMKLLFFRP